MPDGEFKADNVLAKHDENYMPPEVAAKLKEQGLWHEGGRPAPAAGDNAMIAKLATTHSF